MPLEGPREPVGENRPGEKIRQELRELAQLSPEEREERRRAYLQQLKEGGKPTVSPKEAERRKEMLERRKKLNRAA